MAARCLDDELFKILTWTRSTFSYLCRSTRFTLTLPLITSKREMTRHFVMANHSQLDKNPVVESAEFIHGNSKDVFVLKDGIHEAARRIHQGFASTSFSAATWKIHELNPKENSPATVDWYVADVERANIDFRIFLIDLLNFSFWSDRDLEDGSDSSGRYAVEYRGKRWTGYWSLCAAVNRGDYHMRGSVQFLSHSSSR